MASSALITLDLTAPSSVTVSIDSGASITSDANGDVTLTIASPDADTQHMKIYGDVSDTQATSEYRALEANAPWISFATSKTVRLSAGTGSKTVRVKTRDNVLNVSSEASDSITWDTAIPTINITVALTPTKISKQATADTATLSFQSDIALDQWKVNLVTNANEIHSAGTVIPEAGGSDTQGGALAATTTQQVTIKGVDLESAGASGAGATGTEHRIKVFGRSASNQQWSVGSS
jgi:hypothetical protein